MTICPNMKNFLDLLDIKPTLTVNLTVEAINNPNLEIVLNSTNLFSGILTDTFDYSTELNLLDNVDLSITLKNKNYNDIESAAKIIKFQIDSWNLIPSYTHLIDYKNDHNFTGSTAYVGFNGTWQFRTDRPFYQWLHINSGQGWLLKPI